MDQPIYQLRIYLLSNCNKWEYKSMQQNKYEFKFFNLIVIADLM